jgi:tetratricopeptide (TPR) repeat protein
VRAARDRQGEGIALNGLGGAYRLLERWEEADACLRESLTIAEELGDRTTSSGALWNLGQLYVDRNDPHSAALLWARAVQILETFHPRAAQSFALQLHSLLREHNIVLAVFPIKVAAAQDEEANDKLRQ